MPALILYSRQGCCLCEALEERLRTLLPAAALQVVDIDTDPALQARYGLSVPVLAQVVPGSQAEGEGSTITPLPPVPPRLQGESLRTWLERHTKH